MSSNIVPLHGFLNQKSNKGQSRIDTFNLSAKTDRINVFALLKHLKSKNFRDIIYSSTLLYSDRYPDIHRDIFKNKGPKGLLSSENLVDVLVSNSRLINLLEKLEENPVLLELLERLCDNLDVANLFLLQLKGFEPNSAASA